ncbi:MAG: PepSY domain-containing protein [Brachybacterium sp.]|uniref:PepSY domain-containing protein n=1 Tax=unclassified Brachybacterium TaxID=2623841 RepID=UPI003F915AD4
MNRTLIRPRTTARAAALGALVVALAAGCGGTDQSEDGAAPSEGSGTAQEGGDASDEGAATDDGAADDTSTDDSAASDDGGATGSAQQEPAAAALPEDADLATEELPITAERALEIATETVGGGELVQIEIDHDDRAWEWELELIADGTQHELDIDATTGEVTAHDTDDDDDQDPVVDVTSPMAYAEAIEIALGEEPGRVSGWDLDSDDGKIRYQIDIDRADGGDVDVEVDVETGEVRIDD